MSLYCGLFLGNYFAIWHLKREKTWNFQFFLKCIFLAHFFEMYIRITVFTLFGAWIQLPVVSRNPYIWVSAVLSSGGSASYPTPCWCTRDSSYIWPKLAGYLPFMWEAWVEFLFPVLDLDQPWLCWPFGEYLSKWSPLTISPYLCLGYSVFQDRCTNRKTK